MGIESRTERVRRWVLNGCLAVGFLGLAAVANPTIIKSSVAQGENQSAITTTTLQKDPALPKLFLSESSSRSRVTLTPSATPPPLNSGLPSSEHGYDPCQDTFLSKQARDYIQKNKGAALYSFTPESLIVPAFACLNGIGLYPTGDTSPHGIPEFIGFDQTHINFDNDSNISMIAIVVVKSSTGEFYEDTLYRPYLECLALLERNLKLVKEVINSKPALKKTFNPETEVSITGLTTGCLTEAQQIRLLHIGPDIGNLSTDDSGQVLQPAGN